MQTKDIISRPSLEDCAIFFDEERRICARMLCALGNSAACQLANQGSGCSVSAPTNWSACAASQRHLPPSQSRIHGVPIEYQWTYPFGSHSGDLVFSEYPATDCRRCLTAMLVNRVATCVMTGAVSKTTTACNVSVPCAESPGHDPAVSSECNAASRGHQVCIPIAMHDRDIVAGER